jgi:hypothetical protein
MAPSPANLWKILTSSALCSLALLCPAAETNSAVDEKIFGPAFSRFGLTLSPGFREEWVGPLYYHERRETLDIWAIPPFLSYSKDADLDMAEIDFLYPLLSYDRFGLEYRFQILQLFSFAGGGTQDDKDRDRFTLFPFFFLQRGEEGAGYWALFPVYGHLRNRLFRDEIDFILWPGYVRTRKRDVVTWNYLFPVIHHRKGNQLHGWQVWPLVGHEVKQPLQKTNVADEIYVEGGHDRWFALWPIFFKNANGVGTTNQSSELVVLPFIARSRSPSRDSTSYLWPLGLTITEDRERKYKEIGLPWPLWVYAEGPGKHTRRVWPIYSHSKNAHLQSDFILWPIYKYNRFSAEGIERERTRILFFLYSDTEEKNTETGRSRTRREFWPLYSYRKDLEGNERLQVLSVLEPVLPNNKSIERNYSPIYSIWRSEKNAVRGEKTVSLLWNLYRNRQSREGSSWSAFFGMFSGEKDAEGKRGRLFFIPYGERKNAPSRSESEP